jgi:arginine decarboxylase
MNNYYIIGNRIPYEYFITTGKGESDAGSKGLPYETGSYDDALTDAGIQNANIIEYTSVIPTYSKQISKEEGLKRIKWGEVLECIKAQNNGSNGDFISAAVITTDIYDNNNKYLGGFACEYSGNGTKKEAEKSLELSIRGIIERRNFGRIIKNAKLYKYNKTDLGYKIYPGKIFIYESLKIKKHHGSVFASICFVSYRIPLLRKPKIFQKSKKLIKNNKTIKKYKI